MNPKQMHRRCPNSRPVAQAKIRNYKVAINSRGVATIVPSKGDAVSGVVWKISPSDEFRLDCFEGVKCGIYLKKEISASFGNNTKTKVLVYIDRVSDMGMPREGYLEKVIRGVRHFKLGEDYISNLERLAYA